MAAPGPTVGDQTIKVVTEVVVGDVGVVGVRDKTWVTGWVADLPLTRATTRERARTNGARI